MKLIIQTIIALLILAGVIVLLNSCTAIRESKRESKWCKPENIRSGESSRHHDGKKMRAAASPHIEKIRVMWIHRDGPVYHVRYANMKTIEPRVYFKQLPSQIIIEGDWVPVDSLCAWDHRSDSIAKL